MAYGLKYEGSWGSIVNGGIVNVYQQDYAGASEEVKIQTGGVTVNRKWDDWESTHIMLTDCEINIVNDRENYFELFDLLIATERKYKVHVWKTTTDPDPAYCIFEGFVNTEASSQRYLHKSIIRLVCSSYMSKLEYVYPTSLDVVAPITLIDIFSEILTQAGSESNIRVCSDLISAGNSAPPANSSFMNINGLYNEIFWKNNIDRVNSIDIIKDILISFDLYMYYWDQRWYIEDYDKLGETSKDYVEYNPANTYGPLDSGVAVNVTIAIREVKDLVFTKMTQTVNTRPGNRTVQIRVDNQPFWNLTINSFRGAIPIDDMADIPAPIRQWHAWQPALQSLMGWGNSGDPYKSMINSIKRTSSYVNVPDHNNLYDYTYAGYGLYTTFMVTDEGDTSLDLSWKISLGHEFGASLTYKSRWRLRCYDLDDVLLGYIRWDSDNSLWHLSDYNNSINETTQTGADFDEDYIGTFSTNLVLNTIKDYSKPGDQWESGDFKMVLEIVSGCAFLTGKDLKNSIQPVEYYGDIRITASIDENDANVIEGITNTDFIKKLEITAGLSDVPNYNYKNGILYGDNLERLTYKWYKDEVQQRDIVDYILLDKFRMGNITRQRITSKMYSATQVRPFTVFQESKQGGKLFLLTGIRHNVSQDEFDVILEEYDNTTDISLVEA